MSSITKARVEKGLTQAFIAEKLGVSVDLIDKIENGRKVVCNISTLIELSELLGIETNAFFCTLNGRYKIQL